MKEIDLEIPTTVLKLVKSGGLEVRSNSKKSIVITVGHDMIDVNFLDPSPFRSKKKMGIINALEEARDLAKELANNNYTLSVSRKGKNVLKIGKHAKPRFSRLVTRSKALQVVNLRELRRLDKELSA